MSTAEHIEPNNQSIKVQYEMQNYLLDVDMSMMSSSEEQFFIDSENVIKEYLTIPDVTREQIIQGREAFLANLSDKEYIYRTPEGRACWEIQTRVNITEWRKWAKSELGG